MLVVYIATFCSIVLLVTGQPASACKDLDTQACILFSAAKPDLCNEAAFSDSTCKRFCGNCPLECYSCPTPVLNPKDCNVTTTCPTDQTCMIKHLKALDGHDEYIMTCEAKDLCAGFAFGFGAVIGKRDSLDRDRRDVSLSCCDTDFCNFPMPTTTVPPTTVPMTTSPGQLTTSGNLPHVVGCNRDIVFLMDDSGSVGHVNFRHSLDFAETVIQELDIGLTKALTAVVPYSTRPNAAWYLNTYTNKRDTLAALNKVNYVGGTTHTNDALEFVRTAMLTANRGDRPSAENVVIVITDGRSNNKIDTVREANNLHAVSKDVISIVVGHGIDVAELNAIATDNHHVFDVRDYTVLGSILTKVMQVICTA